MVPVLAVHECKVDHTPVRPPLSGQPCVVIQQAGVVTRCQVLEQNVRLEAHIRSITPEHEQSRGSLLCLGVLLCCDVRRQTVSSLATCPPNILHSLPPVFVEPGCKLSQLQSARREISPPGQHMTNPTIAQSIPQGQ
eukprot:3933444-Rhodomonas_salina.1